MKNKVVFIVGPTGIGKTDLAFNLAKQFKGDLISADSIQVYKNLDIISGKDIPKDSKFSDLPELSKNGIRSGYYTYHNIRISLLDVVEPTFSFTVNHFQELASNHILHTAMKNKLPIVVGGTGLYIKALIDGIDIEVKPNLLLRQK